MINIHIEEESTLDEVINEFSKNGWNLFYKFFCEIGTICKIYIFFLKFSDLYFLHVWLFCVFDYKSMSNTKVFELKFYLLKKYYQMQIH